MVFLNLIKPGIQLCIMENVTNVVVEQSPVVTKFKALVASQKAEGTLLQPEKVWEKDGPSLCAVTIEAANRYGNRFKIGSVTNPEFAEIVGAYVKSDRRLQPGGVLPGRMVLYFVKAVRDFEWKTTGAEPRTGMIRTGQSDLRLY
jgi:hypothetical protein